MQLDPVAVIATGILASVGSGYLTTHPHYSLNQRRWAEWAVWGILALGCRLQLRRKAIDSSDANDKESQQDQNSRSIDHSSTLLAALLVSSQYAALAVGRPDSQFIFPLIPLLALLLKLTWQNRTSTASSTWQSRILHHFDGSRSAAVFLGGCAIMPLGLLSEGTIGGFGSITLAMVFFIAVATAYSLASIDHATNGGEGYQLLSSSDHLKLVQSVSSKAFVFCTVYLAVFSVKFPPVVGILAVGLVVLRLCELCAFLALCFNHASVTASALLTPAAAITSTLTSIDTWAKDRFLLVAAASIAVLNTTFSKSPANRRLYLLLLLPGISWLSALISNQSFHHGATIGPVHPIQRLFDLNHQTFQDALLRQSTSVDQAVTEYKRRYRRPPPAGFDRWFEIAQEKEFMLIDEFDTVMETLEPFWGLSPASLRARVKSVELQDAMIGCQVNKSGLTHFGDHHYAKTLKEWAEPDVWGDILPDVKFVISAFDEPRVVAPYDTVEKAMAYALKQTLPVDEDGDGASETTLSTKNDITWINIGKQGTFEGMISSCHITSPARSGKAPPISTGTLAQLPFVSNVTTAMDVCASYDLLHGHGVLAAPDTMILTHSLVPIFSQCKPSVFSDVLYPSPYYGIDGEYPETDDMPWEDKKDRAYWAGSATGGYSTTKNWEKLHRQRLTLMTEPGSQVPAQILSKDQKGYWQPRNTTYAELTDLFHVRVTRTVQCEEEACDAMKTRFRMGDETEPGNAPLASKYALDIDGNAYSGRYYKLLKSNSAVLKHTSFREWHDGRLQPWVHFIPVSPGAEELGEILRFLVHEEEGKEIGRKIADQGKDWARRTLRPIDLEVVFIRVLLEYARIMSDDRESLNYPS